MPIERLKRFLGENAVRWVTTSHSRAFTAQEAAAVTHTAFMALSYADFEWLVSPAVARVAEVE